MDKNPLGIMVSPSSDSWEISHSSSKYTLTSKDYEGFHKEWKVQIKGLFKDGMRVLIINGGDQHVFKALPNKLDVSLYDPFAYHFCEEPFATVLQTSALLNTTLNKFVVVDMTFDEALEDMSINIVFDKFDAIIVCPGYTEDNKDITSQLFIEKCYLLLKDQGFLLFEIPKSHYKECEEFKPSLDHYFTELSRKYKYSQSSSQSFVLSIYRKFANLVV